MKDYFSLYSYCIPVNGINQSVICDLQRASYTEVPQFLFEVFEEFAESSISELEMLYNDKKKSIYKYLTSLSAKNLGRFSSEPLEFKRMSLEWKRPEPLVTCVVDMGDSSTYDIFHILDQIEKLHCKYLEIRFFRNAKQSYIEDILHYTSSSQLRTIDVILPFSSTDDEFNLKTYRQRAMGYKKLCNTILYGTNKNISWKNECIFTTDRNLSSPIAFQNIAPDKYIISSPFFTESQKHNPFFNRKMCIDQYGFLKNDSSHDKSFGHVSTDKIADVLSKEDFQKLWYVNNDQILDIKDSPLRYIWMNTHELEQVNDTLFRMK